MKKNTSPQVKSETLSVGKRGLCLADAVNLKFRRVYGMMDNGKTIVADLLKPAKVVKEMGASEMDAILEDLDGFIEELRKFKRDRLRKQND
jgi:hypothetical protein